MSQCKQSDICGLLWRSIAECLVVRVGVPISITLTQTICAIWTSLSVSSDATSLDWASGRRRECAQALSASERIAFGALSLSPCYRPTVGDVRWHGTYR